MIRFLETDSETKVIAKPQLRGAEGSDLKLNLGEDIPVPSTTFTPLAQGGANFNPLTSFTYRPVGVTVQMTPRVSIEGDIQHQADDREQQPRRRDHDRRPGAAVVRLAESGDGSEAARRGVDAARRTASGAAAQACCQDCRG